MKTLILSAGILCNALVGYIYADDKPNKISEKDILSARESDPMLKIKSAVPQSSKTDIDRRIENNEVFETVCYNGQAITLLKSSIVHLPEKLKHRLIPIKGSQYVSIKEFLAQNRGWIGSIEITVEQASGKVPLSDSTNKMLATCSNIMIATLDSNPVSYIKYQEKQK